MSFCGQCGNLLAPNAKKCPRCGATVPNDASTVQAQSENLSSAEEDYATQQSVDSRETEWMASGDQNAKSTAGPADWEQTIPPHAAAGSFYPPSYNMPAENHPIGVSPSFMPGGETYPDPTPSPDYPMNYPESSYHTPAPPAPTKKSSTALTLAIIAFVFAAALTATLLAMKPGTLDRLLGHIATPTVTAITPTPSPTAAKTPEQQAQAVIEQYFNYINQKNYQAAYNLWTPSPSSYQSFVNGFAHTKHDDIQTGSITQQNDGTVQVPIVITALTDKDTKDTFSGYYVVGQQPDGSWKITGAKINPGASS
ncbi:hypothetical protein KSF_062880 [Reticulibacter mediterranei]|uniref:Zinc-ribbon domain-containing protein n=1 Tax=Reticulibacter mediterranei TaxID=2778369 RepID=A0A8J3ISR6_9CHLR|nr:hypothetical protein [Reticulibacter mediterranei]GHO96240.1 hypothetical protein KSF_062880 [Reticulibacter mediterranei]